jgi:hypothetical protein
MSPRETADDIWFASWRASHYDPETECIVLIGHPPEYVAEHERAHARQHATRSRLWRLWLALHRVPLAGRLAHLLLEIDADERALTRLHARGLWDAENARARRLVLRAIFRAHLGGREVEC